MEDMERYGDYNEVDDEPAEGKARIFGIVIKVLIAVVCAAVIGVVAFRITLFNTYPAEVSRLVYSDALADYYRECGGDMKAYTQDPGNLRYDDPAEGNFFFDKLVIVPDAGHLQVTVRYNTSLMDSIKQKYGVELDPDADPADIFEFKLIKTAEGYVSSGDEDESVPLEVAGTESVYVSASTLMYRYARVGFDGVEFGFGDGEEQVGWIRLDVYIKGVEMASPYSLPVYLNTLDLIEYNLSGEEVPD